MTSKTLNGSSSLLIISGILLAIGMLFHPDISRPGFATSGAWVPVHLMLGLSALFGLVGLAGLFAVMNLHMRPFGKAAFGLSMLGNLLLTGIMFFVEAAIVPVLARDPAYQPLITAGGPLMSGGLGIAIAISALIAAIGFLAVAWYLVDTRTISIANAALFIGAPMLLFSPPLTPIIGTIGGVLLGAGITWLGFSIRVGVAHRSLESTLRVQDECLTHLGHA